MRLDLFLTTGRFLTVEQDTEKIIEEIRYGKSDFIEVVDKTGLRHLVNVNQIIEVKIITHPMTKGERE